MSRMKQTWKTLSLDDLLAAYRKGASEHGRATESGQSDAANAAYDEIVGAYNELRSRGPEALARLPAFISDLDPGVRLWAGSHSLLIDPQSAEKVLTALAAQPKSLVAFSASVTLKEWRKGNLKF